MNLRERQRVETRRAILEAVAAELAESGIAGFSIQAVADRAGVTHRTVYNHFPTREALNDAFAVHVEELLGSLTQGYPEDKVDVGGLPKLATLLFDLAGPHAVHLQAYVMLTIATNAAAQVFRDRSKKLEKLVDDELGPFEPGVAKLVTAAFRMFMSSAGWFLLSTQHGLTAADGAAVSEWATKTLLDAARRGNVPKRPARKKTTHV